MPDKTSGQPMDSYAGTCGGTEYGNSPPASAKDAVPLTAAKTDPSVPIFDSWSGAIGGETKGGDKGAPMFAANESMQNSGGPH